MNAIPEGRLSWEERARRLAEVRAEALRCQRCHLWRTRTQVVFGEGKVGAAVMLVGEGPGESEDREGHPFVGRAGVLLNGALRVAGLLREEIWITNLVRSRPVRKVDNQLRNRAPLAGEVEACRVWMEAELRYVRPRVVVCLGAVPAHYLIHRGFRLHEERGRLFDVDGTRRLATYHPAYILRLRGGDNYRRTLALLEEDLRLAASASASPA